MAWQSRSLREHITDAVRAFNAYLPGADAALARNNLKPVAKIIGGAKYELERFAAFASDQKFILTCDESLLDRHGAEMKPAVLRKDASPAKGQVTVTATTAISLATGALLTRSDGESFSVDAGIVLAGAGTTTVQVTAILAGAASATESAAVMTASAGLTGSATFAVAAAGLGGAADREAGPAYRARLLFAKAFPDHAGAPADWLRYTLAVPGVTRAFIEPLGQGRGTVVVYPFFDLSRPNGIPLESDRAAVLSALLVSGPGAALPVVRIAEAVPINMVLSGVTPGTPEVYSAIASEIATTFFRNSRVAGAAASHPSMPFLATPASFSRSWIWQAAANASGEQSHVLVTPTTDQALTSGQTAVPGTLTFA